MSTTVPLNQSAFGVLNASGNATVSLGPVSAREQWSPQNVHVQVSGPVTNEASCYIYVGNTPTQENFRDASQSGSTGDSSDRVNADTVMCGHKVWAVWSGGDPGHQASLMVTGSRTV